MDEQNDNSLNNNEIEEEHKHSLRNIWVSIKRFASLHPDSDGNATIARIEEGVVFRGTNVWILAFAIIIASVGLNVNSTAVIIGAMLISPLMGPIMGIGLAIGTWNFVLLKKSLKNFAYMVIISLLASTLYFWLSPLSDAQSELLARTSPSIYDVLIAFFGGLAGIVAHSRKGEKTTIIAGVAIATALMPPLCTAGYGIAIGELKYFLGALYLFFINSFFIALATTIIVNYIKLPKHTEISPQRGKKIKRTIVILTVLVCVPSIFFAVRIIRESAFNSNAIAFVNSLEKNPLLTNTSILSSNRTYGGRDSSEIVLVVAGNTLSAEQIDNLQNTLSEFSLDKTKLSIRQISSASDDEDEVVGDLLKKNEQLLQQIENYKTHFDQMNASAIPNKQIAKEIKVQFEKIHSFAFGNMEYTNVSSLSTDTFPTVIVHWSDSYTQQDTSLFNSWLKVRLEKKNIRISHKIVVK
ncbi:MAG: DUF389 domain-containing protein [Bacteroidales bacterium]|jgi:uncharacterized hydrophobic protein (TIGR00271 family)|nr:DUF389 domain-containing protein [Bacteroidales bacterium]